MGFLTVCVSFTHLPVQVLPVDTLGRAWLVNACMTPLPGPPVYLSFTSAACDTDCQSSAKASNLCRLSYFCLQSSSTPVLQLEKQVLPDPRQWSHQCLKNSVCGIPQPLLAMHL